MTACDMILQHQSEKFTNTVFLSNDCDRNRNNNNETKQKSNQLNNCIWVKLAF